MTPEFKTQASLLHRDMLAGYGFIETDDRLRELGNSLGVNLNQVCERANTLEDLEVPGVDLETVYLFAILVCCQQLRAMQGLLEMDS